MTKENQTSPELQHQAVKLDLPADLLEQLDEVRKQAEKLSGGNPNWLEEQTQNSKGYDLYGHDMSEFTGNLDVLEKSGLEPFNFRVDSSGWRIEEARSDGRKIQIKVNPEGDIWEYVSGVSQELIGEQLFTWDAAMRETEKCGKMLPSKEDWEIICAPYVNDGVKLSQELGLVFSGRRDNANGAFYGATTSGGYWSTTPSTSDARSLYFNSSNINPSDYFYRAYGFSVRCIKN